MADNEDRALVEAVARPVEWEEIMAREEAVKRQEEGLRELEEGLRELEAELKRRERRVEDRETSETEEVEVASSFCAPVKFALLLVSVSYRSPLTRECAPPPPPT